MYQKHQCEREKTMGLAASQARLLSITARLSDNELHSQQISNSKVRLADKTLMMPRVMQHKRN